MRIGKNPAKNVEEVAQPAKVTVAVIVYIPFMSGYFKESLQVLDLCLASLHQNTKQPFDLMVFDNGSCDEVVEYLNNLKSRGYIQFLALSDKNIGKVGAWNFIFRAAPGDFLCYCDSDVFFYPGWLEPHLDILNTYPDVGMVVGRPNRKKFVSCNATMALLESDSRINVEKGHLIPKEWIDEHVLSLGKSPDDYYKQNEGAEDFRLTMDGVSAYVGQGHWQFVSRTDVLRSVAPLESNRPVGSERCLDEAIDDGNYLRLATTERYVAHIGNRLGEEWGEKAVELSLVEKAKRGQVPSNGHHSIVGRMVKWKPARVALTKIHNNVFELLYSNAR